MMTRLPGRVILMPGEIEGEARVGERRVVGATGGMRGSDVLGFRAHSNSLSGR